MKSWIKVAALALATVGGASGAAHAAIAAPDSSRDTLSRVVRLPEVIVSTARPGDRAPIARSVLGRERLQELNWGQDTPMALATLPGAYAYSDAGNGVGYSYLFIRGFPQRRISVLVNGVPLNDPQSHEVYWIDHPDLLASTAEVEVQRGVGPALYGAASVGGSVNLETAPFGAERRMSATAGYGSWDTRRWSLEMDSGPLEGGWNLYGRYSRIESDGYRERSWSKLWSYTLAARRAWGRQSVRLNLYGGPEETHLSYLGVTRDVLEGGRTGDRERDRRFNPITYEGERDHFFEPHYELIHSWAPGDAVALTQTLFWFDGEGFYDEQRRGSALADYRLAPWATADSTLAPRGYYAQDSTGALTQDGQGRFTVERGDLVRRRAVENRHFGWVPRVRLGHKGGALTLGGELRWADGRHHGEVVSGSPLPPGTEPHHAYYDYHPRTFAGSVFAREEWSLSPALLVTADLAWRHQSYAMRGDRFDGVRFDQPYDFALPRLGLTWTPRPGLQAFASWAHARREPAFRDLYDAEGAGSVPLYRVRDVANGVFEDPLIRPERVSSVELGAGWSRAAASATLNLFHMSFRDELVYAGQFDTDLGYPILGNAARSVHRGVELAARSEWRAARGWRLSLDGNATLSDNHFVEFRESYGPAPGDQVSYDGNAIGFFPAVLGNLGARAGWRSLTLGAELQHAGRLHLDHTESRAASIDPRSILNLSGALETRVGGGPRAELSVRVLNAAGTEYETGGYMDFGADGSLVPVFIPAATRSWLAQVRVEF